MTDIGRPAGGTLRLRGSTYELTDAFAVLDRGRGKWPYPMTWNWGAGCGKGVAIRIGGTWTASTGSTENALFLNGRAEQTTFPGWIWRVLNPLPEAWLENVVEIDADSADLTLVDLELVQVRLGVNEALGTPPVVLPEVRAQPVL